MDFCDFDANLFFSLLATTLLFTSSRNSFWIGSYYFSKIGLRRNLGFLSLAAARVYALFLLASIQSTVHDTVDCLDVMRTVHPAWRALRAAGLGCCACWAARLLSSRLSPMHSRLPDATAKNRLVEMCYPVDYFFHPVDCCGECA